MSGNYLDKRTIANLAPHADGAVHVFDRQLRCSFSIARRQHYQADARRVRAGLMDAQRLSEVLRAEGDAILFVLLRIEKQLALSGSVPGIVYDIGLITRQSPFQIIDLGRRQQFPFPDSVLPLEQQGLV